MASFGRVREHDPNLDPLVCGFQKRHKILLVQKAGPVYQVQAPRQNLRFGQQLGESLPFW